MEPAMFLALILFVPLAFFLIRNKSSKRLPPGSFGLPIIGQSLEFFGAMRANKAEEWFQERVKKYGPVSKLSLFGTPTVFLSGQAANKFIYTCDQKIIDSQQPVSIRRIFGERSILELSGQDHKRIRGALVSFLKPEALKLSVVKLDEEIKIHLKQYWHAGQEITVMPLMKTLTFNMICTLIFGIERGARRDAFLQHFEHLAEGLFNLPLNLPFTRFRKGLRARSNMVEILLELLNEKRAKLETGDILGHQDLITNLLNMRDENNSALLSDLEIIDNCIFMMGAGYDTTSIVLTFFIKLLAEDPDVYRNVLNEHEEIAKGKSSSEILTWEELSKMKYTWRVATELMRMNPPIFNSFRKVHKEFEIGGYVIPKGWQVTWAGCMTHLDESIFPDSLKFDPSRFENPGEIPPYSLVHFGAGRRICPGYEFARIEAVALIHYLVTGFQWKLCLEENTFGRNPFPIFHQGLPIIVDLKRKPGRDAL